MRITDPSKLFVLLVAIVVAGVLLALDAVSESAGVGIISAALGYAVGNGRTALGGQRSSPMIGPRDELEHRERER